MSVKVQRNTDFLTLLARSKPQLRRALLEKCNGDQADCLCELVLNLLEGKLPVSKEDVSELKRVKKVLRTLRSKKVPLTKKKKLFKKISLPLVNKIVKPALSYFKQ